MVNPVALQTITREAQTLSACGAPVAAPMTLDEARARADVLKALADPVRLQLLSIIEASPNSEACVCDMTELVDVSQPTVSHHLKVLVDAGILDRERRGSWAWFTMSPGLTDSPVRALISRSVD